MGVQELKHYGGNHHPYTRQFIGILEQGKPGDEIPFKRFEEICGRKVSQKNGAKGGGYGWLHSARRHVERHRNLVWVHIPDAEVVRCLTPEEVVATTTAMVSSNRRAAKKTARRTGTVPLNSLDEESKRTLLTNQAISGMMAAFASKKTRELVHKNQAFDVDHKKVLENLFDAK